MKRLLIILAAIVASIGIAATPAIASVPLHVDMETQRDDTGSMFMRAHWHIGYTSMKACELAITNERADQETHSVRIEVYRPSDGTIYFSTVINGVVYGEEVGPLGHIMDLVSIGSSGIAMRAKWGDSSVWHVMKTDRSQSEVSNTLFPFGSFYCP